MEVVVCFNRNIVECKEKNPDIIVDLGASFNRNIVECKESRPQRAATEVHRF